MKYLNGPVLLLLASLQFPLSAQQAGYPAPRFPDIPETVTDEHLIEIARKVVARPGGNRLLPGYAIERGETALILVTPLYDPRVYQAIAGAIRERGADPDVFIGDTPDFPPSGASQNPIFLFMHSNGNYMERMLAGGLTYEQVAYIGALRDYDLVIAGFGGPKPKADYRWEEIPWHSVDEFVASNAQVYPPELLQKIDRKAWEMFRQARKVRVTDPEGTDISWKVPADITTIDEPVRYWMEWLCMPDYLRGKSSQSAEAYAFTDLNGVIAGTINHVGAFPHMKVHVKNNQIERIEGGGDFGNEWRKVLEQYGKTEYPHHPGPGFQWVQECAIGGVPTSIRPRDAMRFPFGTVSERRRSGIYHWAFGVQNLLVLEPSVQEYIREHRIPDGHFDVHNNFPTMIIETVDGKEITFIDKGRLSALDDPEVREFAKQFGEPGVLLNETWIPPVPGINVKGDYMTDYGNDPINWISREYGRFFSEK